MGFQDNHSEWSAAAGLRGSPQLMRRMNQVQVLGALRTGGPMARPGLSKATGLSKITVDAVVTDLLQRGLVDESAEPQRGGPGRPARLVSFRHRSRFAVGVDIGATKVLVGVADLSGEVIHTQHSDTSAIDTGRKLINAVRRAVRSAIRDAGVDESLVAGICLGTPGVIDPVSQIVRLAPQLPDWEGVALAEKFSDAVNVPVCVENEVHLAVLAEQWQGAAQGERNVAYVHLGVGVGLGVLIDGRLIRGAHGGAGEIGYLPLTPDGSTPRTFESQVGNAAYADALHHLIATGRLGKMNQPAPTGQRANEAQVLYSMAAAGDRVATEAVDELLRRTAIGIAAVVVTLDPSIVIVGGGISQAGDAMLATLRRYVQELVPIPPTFARARLGAQAPLLGAVHRAVELCEAQILGLE